MNEASFQNHEKLQSEVTHYQVLDVRPNASKSEIREAYIRLKNTFSGQNQAIYSLLSENDALDMLASVEQAFRILNDDTQRRLYDEQIGLRQPAESDHELPLNTAEAYAAALQRERIEALRASSAGELATSEQYVKGAVHRYDRTTAKKTHAPAAGKQELTAKMSEVIADSDPGDGTLYRKLRELAGVTDEEMQDRTKICIEYIRAIENNTFDRLPRSVFVKGFLKSYLRYLVVPDSEKLVQAFAQRLEDWQKNHSA